MDTAFLDGLFESPWTPVLADAGVKGIVLLAIAALAARAMRRSSAAARHLVWMLALMGLLVLPVVSLVAPQWQLPLLPTLPARPAAGVPPALTVPETALALPPQAYSAPVLDPRPPSQPALMPIAAGPAPRAPEPEAATPPLPLASSLPGLWLAVALALLAPVVLGHAALFCARRRAETYPHAGLQTLKGRLGHTLGLRALVVLLRAARGAMPMAAGLVRPAVFLPEEAQTWPEARQRAVLLHELAHVKRRDCLTHALARVAVALHWFNPLAWYALRQLRIEREHACDDLVLAAGERPSDYAENLLEIARTLRAGRLTAAAGITMAKRSHLEGRLLAILDAARNRGLLTWKFVVVAVLGATGTAALLGGATLAREISSTDDLRDMAAPVKETSLEGFFGGWRNLPFQLSDAEAAAIAKCLELAQQHRSTHNDVNQFTVPEVRASLEAILAANPELFYAEYLLGTWHRMNGDNAAADAFLRSAYRHAPVVVIQRYEDAKGKPIASAPVRHYALECNRVQGGSLDPSLELEYFGLTTDADGCIYLPVYDTVYRRNAMASLDGYDVNYPRLGWFKSRGKVAMLPVAAEGIIGSAYEDAIASDEGGTVNVAGRTFGLSRIQRMTTAEALETLAFPVWPYDFPHRDRFPELAEGDWDCLLVDIGGKSQFPKDFDVVQFRVFDHEARKLIWDSDWRNYSEEQGKDFTGGFCSALNNAVFLARRDGDWPAQIDLWFRVNLLKDSPDAHNYLPVKEPDAVIRTTGTGGVAIEEVRAGAWNCQYSEGGGDVTWNALNPGTEEAESTVVLRRSGDWDGENLSVCAVDVRGNKHWPGTPHFIDFQRTALTVVRFPVAADQIHSLELDEVEHPTDFRKTFYFDGIDIAAARQIQAPEATPETTAVNTGQSLPSYLLGAWAAPGKHVVIARKNFNLGLALEFREDGSISGTLGAAALEKARLVPWSPDDTARYHEEFDHKLEAAIRGPLGDTPYNGPIVIGLVDNGAHWLARPFLNLSAMGAGGDEWLRLSAYLMQPQASLIAGSIPNASLVVYNGPRGSGSSCRSGIGNFGIGRTSTMSCGYPGAVSVVTCTGLGRDGKGWRFAFTRTFPSDGPSPETTTKEVVYTGGTLAVFEDEHQWIGFKENDETPPPPEGRVEATIPSAQE
jgi:beta-lactamase regulating signal transducer with metallopeptidase domain